MELIIYTPKNDEFGQMIEFNYEELKTQVGNALAKYSNLVFTPETAKDGKKTLADLRRFRTAIEDKRKDVKAKCLEPYNEFESKVKEIVALVDKPIAAIDVQLKTYEAEAKKAKMDGLRSYFNEQALNASVQDIASWDMALNLKWENVSFTLNNAQAEIDEYIAQVAREVIRLNNMQSEYKFEMLEEYKRTNSLDRALAKGEELRQIAAKKAEHEERQKHLAEQAKGQEKQLGAELGHTNVLGKMEIKPGAFDGGKTVSFTNSSEQPKESEQIMTLRFRVFGNREQLLALRDFMNAAGIQFEKI